MKPRYQHDCDQCVYLGTILAAPKHSRYRKQAKYCDLYFCPGEPTVIGRYSSEGADYGSGLEFGVLGKFPYAEALSRALAKGLIKESDLTSMREFYQR